MAVPATASAASTWEVQSTPNLPGAAGNFLNAVFCFAVGDGINNADSTLVENWNGSIWTAQSTPSPSGAYDEQLDAISCASTTMCMAVGQYLNSSSGPQVTLAEEWNGARWAFLSPPNPSTGGTTLEGVSCSSPTTCIAVGWYLGPYGNDSYTLAEFWNGSKWERQVDRQPPGPVSNQLSAISCTSFRHCIAVGQHGYGVALIENWNGTAWSVVGDPKSAGLTQGSDLQSISCASSSNCTAVGTWTPKESEALAMYWNGSNWVVQNTAVLRNSFDSDLTGVSCASTEQCTAVGAKPSGTSGDSVTLAEGWNGSKWIVEPTANPGTSMAFLGVSCFLSATCTAVGYYDNSTLAERN